MCIEVSSTSVADEDIPVFKVLMQKANEPRTLFYTHVGRGDWRGTQSIRCDTPHKNILTPEDICNEDAIAFLSGRGYSCFREEELAKKYIQILVFAPRKRVLIMAFTGLVIISFKIPEGSSYHEGIIPKGCYGSGMPALAAERLKQG